MTREELKNNIFVGIVEDNEDPRKIGRIKVRVAQVFDAFPKEDIPWAKPWKDLNGNQFILPEVGKVVSVVFDNGDIYNPEYIFAEHYNINLETKLSELSSSGYKSMRAIMFDHKTQIYSNDDEGLKIDYKFNNINLTSESINLNLKDNFSKVNLGSDQSNQQAILGNHFLDWFDEFVDNLLGKNQGPYLGNSGAPVVANPAMVKILNKYKKLKEPKFLSHHINIVDNEYVEKQERVNIPQLGDSATGFATTESVDYVPMSGVSTDTPDGQLTTSSNSQGQIEQFPDAQPIMIPSDNPDISRILAAMKKKGYTIFTRPYELNIIGVRNQYQGERYSNAFKDEIYAIYKTDNTDNWIINRFRCSTMPGYYSAKVVNGKLQKDSTGQSPSVKESSVMQSRGGMGILMEGQYINLYEIGSHSGRPALVTGGRPQKFYRDNSKGDIIKFTSSGQGSVGMYIHRGFPGGIAVNNWSEGCQVIPSQNEINKLFSLCEKHRSLYGNRFSYTLVTGRDLG
jgi:hypothetical protein